jgi:hypothetical protein
MVVIGLKNEGSKSMVRCNEDEEFLLPLLDFFSSFFE